jgi:hypothetical protein
VRGTWKGTGIGGEVLQGTGTTKIRIGGEIGMDIGIEIEIVLETEGKMVSGIWIGSIGIGMGGERGRRITMMILTNGIIERRKGIDGNDMLMKRDMILALRGGVGIGREMRGGSGIEMVRVGMIEIGRGRGIDGGESNGIEHARLFTTAPGLKLSITISEDERRL